ncbi:SNF2-related [Penicillium occitanis (nom. inval.)]|nr:SNF2-related [Penicillium occitanis (nom. inval.)]PCH08755.1 hypothetical protein PENOC_012730 [Penicillium occitanis (nom. inval.)]
MPGGHVLLVAPTNAALNALSKTLVKDYPELERDFTVDIDGEARRERIPQLTMIWQDMVPINVRSLLKSPPRRRHPSRVFDIVPAWSGKLTGNVQVVILDEAHKIKNPSSQSHSSIRELHARFYVLRSATPMIKDAFDLKTLFDIILKQEMNKEWNKSSPTEQDENLFLQSECRSEYIQNPPDIMFAPEATSKWIWREDRLKKEH